MLVFILLSLLFSKFI